MRITKRTNLAMRVLMYCAANSGRNVTKAEIAEGCNSSEHHLGHVVNQLGHFGYLRTLRGRRGGVRLARPPKEINVGAVFRDFESEVPVAECFSDENTCPLTPVCMLRPEIAAAVEAFYRHLDKTTVAGLVRSNGGLQSMLGTERAA